MATGEDYGTWGNKLNTIISTIDTNMGSQWVLSNPATTVALTQTQAENFNIIFNGSLSGNTIVTLPPINGPLFYKSSSCTRRIYTSN